MTSVVAASSPSTPTHHHHHNEAKAVPAAVPAHPSLHRALHRLRGGALRRVLCSPCSLTNDVFAAVALFDDAAPLWIRKSCMQALGAAGQEEEVDIEKCLRDFRKSFRSLYEDFGAVDVEDVEGVVELEASIGDNRTATTASVYLLPEGNVVCFETRDYVSRPSLTVLQRTGYAAARTFDALMLMPNAASRGDRAFELRLIEKHNVADFAKWGERARLPVVCSPGSPLSAHLVLRAFADGSTVEEIVEAIVGEDDDDSESDDSDVEWCADEDACSDDTEEDSDDSDFDALDAEEELANLR